MKQKLGDKKKHNTSLIIPKKVKLNPIKENSNIYLFLSLGFILLATFFTFYPSLFNAFTNWDDMGYITENTLLQHANLFDYFFKDAFVMSNYHPLTMVTFAVEYSLVKLNPSLYHIDNFILHFLNTGLVFWFVFSLTGFWQTAAITALLFGIHPMHVESVAWASERKDVLYTFFYLSSLISYVYFVKAAKNKFYILSLILFVFSLLSKGQAVTLTFVLFLIDYFLNKEFNRKNILNKAPFIILSIIFGVIAVVAQKSGQSINNSVSIIDSFFCASFGLVNYLYKLFLPFQLSCFYPYPDKTGNWLPFYFYLAPILLIIITFIIYKKWGTNKNVVFGCLFFLLTIAPVIQLLPVGLSIVSDRYSYIPYIGLFFILGQITVQQTLVNKKYLALAILFISLIFSFTSNQRCKVWKTSETLWKDELNAFPNYADGYNSLGLFYVDQSEYYFKKGQIDLSKSFLEKASQNYTKAFIIDPKNSSAIGNIGIVEMKQEKFDSAIFHISKAILLNPQNVDFYNWRGSIYNKMGYFRLAINDFKKVIADKPDHKWAFGNLGQCYSQIEIYDSAIIFYNRMLEIQPENEDTYIKRGVAFFMQKFYQKSIDDLDKALSIDPKDARGYVTRSTVFFELKNYNSALKDAITAKELGISIPEEYLNEINTAIRQK